MSEPALVTGVVHPRGAGGGKSRGAEMWTLRFSFETWRSADGTLHSNELSVYREVTQNDLRNFMNRIQPYTVYPTRVLFTGPISAQLLELLSPIFDEDDPLVQRAAYLQLPKIVEHNILGTLTLDRRVDDYTAHIKWSNTEAELYLPAVDEIPIENAVRTAIELLNDQQTWNERIQNYAVKELLNLKNDTWLEDDQNEFTPEQFKKLMTLESIHVSAERQFEFFYDDGDLFFGHVIIVSGNLDDGPTDADIAG